MQINSDTRIMGLLGNPLKHSLSPVMHNLTLEKMGLNYVYLPLQIEPAKLGEAVAALKSLDFIGVNVTIPFKEKVIKYLDDLSPEAAACRAVNLIKNEKGCLVGYNTDGKGFLEALKEENVPLNGRAVFIGAGGAARSIAYELAVNGFAELGFFDIDYNRAIKLADFISETSKVRASAGVIDEGDFIMAAGEADVVINCSPVGMYPNVNRSPVTRLDMLKPQATVCDIIYNPLVTTFLQMGQANGHKTINGVPMFVHQAALTLKILTGEMPPVEFMQEVVLYQLK